MGVIIEYDSECGIDHGSQSQIKVCESYNKRSSLLEWLDEDEKFGHRYPYVLNGQLVGSCLMCATST